MSGAIFAPDLFNRLTHIKKLKAHLCLICLLLKVFLKATLIKSWRFNLTRYVQHVVNDTEPVYDLRLFSPLGVRELYRPGAVGSTSSLVPISVNGAIGKGRVRLAGNTGPADTNPQKMRLRIVYSKI